MELSQMTALELSRNIRGKKICVSDSVESVFHQIRKKEKKIHAYLDLYEEDAYKRAEQVQKGIEQGIYTGPLAGVPIAVKDISVSEVKRQPVHPEYWKILFLHIRLR